MKISGRFCRRCRGLAEPQLKTSCAMPNGEGVSSACGCRRWTKTIRNHGRRRPRAAGKNPPIAGELPDTLELVVGNEIYIAKDGLPPGLRNRLLRLAAFQNPEFYKAQAMRLPTYDKPRIIACAEDYPQHIGLPRGCMEDVQQLLSDLNITSCRA